MVNIIPLTKIIIATRFLQSRMKVSSGFEPDIGPLLCVMTEWVEN